MATTQTFETIIHLNAQEAKNEMAALKKSLDELKKKKAEALRDPGSSVKDINKFDKQIKAADEYTDDKNNDSTDIAVDEQFRSELEEKLNAAYAYEPLTKISAKFTATELAANLREKNGEENYGLFIGKPSFLTENNTGKLSGKRRGDGRRFIRTYRLRGADR